MTQRLLHTPEGVRDIYNEECERKLVLQKKLLEKLHSYGYRDIETPTFEFFDVFGKEVGTVPSKDLYKFFDREGNTLVLRPDITPSVARAAAKYYDRESMPVRLCYMGNTFINNSSYQGRLKETTQIGAEFIGDNRVCADAETVALVIDTLLAAGLTDFQVSLGHVDFFQSLCEEAGFDEELEEELKSRISNKNPFGVEELLEEQKIPEELKKLFASLPQMFGNAQVLARAAGMTRNPKALAAVNRLLEISRILEIYGFEKYVSFDLGMLSKYMYYTGIIFRGYTFGTGEAIVKGGRYDRLLEHFGKEAPSVGFVVVTDQLLNALARQKISLPGEPKPLLLLYEPQEQHSAIRKAQELRSHGTKVVLMEASKTDAELASYVRRGGFSGAARLKDKNLVMLPGEERGDET